MILVPESTESRLTYVGGPYAGQTTTPNLSKGNPKMLEGAVTEAKKQGFSLGVYKRQGDHMVWTSLPGEWK